MHSTHPQTFAPLMYCVIDPTLLQATRQTSSVYAASVQFPELSYDTDTVRAQGVQIWTVREPRIW